MKLPIKDIHRHKRAKVSLEPYLTILIFSLKSLKILKEFSKDVNRRAIGVYIGNQLPTLKSWCESHTKLLDMKLLDIYDGGSLKYWKDFGVKEKPWVLVVDTDDILLSMSVISLPRPYFKNIVIRMKIPNDFKYDSDEDNKKSQQIGLEKEKINLETDENQKIQKIPSNELRMNELVKVVMKNHEEIEKLREMLCQKDKIIENINEKLCSLEIRNARFKAGTPAFERKESYSVFLNVKNSFLGPKNSSLTPVPEKKKMTIENFKYSKLRSDLLGNNLRKSEDLKYIYHY